MSDDGRPNEDHDFENIYNIGKYEYIPNLKGELVVCHSQNGLYKNGVENR